MTQSQFDIIHLTNAVILDFPRLFVSRTFQFTIHLKRFIVHEHDSSLVRSIKMIRINTKWSVGETLSIGRRDLIHNHTQGDTLSMLIYAVVLLPLVKLMKTKKNRISWMSKAQHMDTFTSPKKSCLIVTPQFEDEARLVFGDLGVQLVNGHHLLGDVIGDCMAADIFMRKKLQCE